MKSQVRKPFEPQRPISALKGLGQALHTDQVFVQTQHQNILGGGAQCGHCHSGYVIGKSDFQIVKAFGRREAQRFFLAQR